MSQNNPNRKHMTFEEQKQAILIAKKKHEERMRTDPEYRKETEEIQKLFERNGLLNDTIED